MTHKWKLAFLKYKNFNKLIKIFLLRFLDRRHLKIISLLAISALVLMVTITMRDDKMLNKIDSSSGLMSNLSSSSLCMVKSYRILHFNGTVILADENILVIKTKNVRVENGIIIMNKSIIELSFKKPIQSVSILSTVKVQIQKDIGYSTLCHLISDDGNYDMKFLYFNGRNIYGVELWDSTEKTIINRWYVIEENTNVTWAIIKNGENLYLYIDGVLKATLTPRVHFNIGKIVLGYYSEFDYLVGDISNLSVYSTSLTLDQILEYTFGKYKYNKPIIIGLSYHKHFLLFRILRTSAYILFFFTIWYLIINKILIAFNIIEGSIPLSLHIISLLSSFLLLYRILLVYNVAWGDQTMHSINNIVDILRYYFWLEKSVIPAKISINPQTVPSFLLWILIIDVPASIKANPYIIIAMFSIYNAIFLTLILTKYFLKLGKISSIIATATYIVNPVSALYMNWVGYVSLAYGLMPLAMISSLALLDIIIKRGFNNNVKKTIIFSVIVFYLMTGIFQNILVILAALNIISFILSLGLSRDLKKCIWLVFPIMLVAISFSIPDFYFLKELYTSHEVTSLKEQFSSCYSSSTLVKTLTFLGPAAMKYWSPFYNNKTLEIICLIWISLILPLAIFALNKNLSLRKKMALFHSLLIYLIFMFFAYMMHKGFGTDILFNTPIKYIIAPLRNNDRIYFALLPAFLLIFAISIDSLMSDLRKTLKRKALFPCEKDALRLVSMLMVACTLLFTFLYLGECQPILDGAFSMSTLNRLDPQDRFTIVLPASILEIRDLFFQVSPNSLYIIFPFDEIPIGRYLGYSNYFVNVRSYALYLGLSQNDKTVLMLSDSLVQTNVVNVMIAYDFEKTQDSLLTQAPQYYEYRYKYRVNFPAQVIIIYDNKQIATLILTSNVTFSFTDSILSRRIYINNMNEIPVQIPLVLVNGINSNSITIDERSQVSSLANITLYPKSTTCITIYTPICNLILYNIPFILSFPFTVQAMLISYVHGLFTKFLRLKNPRILFGDV